ncbi:hypothetical protein BMJ22_09785 [Sinorhizobium medicae]|nr:hypothetical protein BMJ22_09785 [Sinorhizobium medicae]
MDLPACSGPAADHAGLARIGAGKPVAVRSSGYRCHSLRGGGTGLYRWQLPRDELCRWLPGAPWWQDRRRAIPERHDTAYRGASVQHVLDMTSGVVFDETYTALDSHMAQLDVASGWKNRWNPSWHTNIWDLILSLKDLECPHGTSFRYRSIETDVLSFVLQRAAATPLAELVSRELWAPMGAEEDAYFTVDAAGYALGNGGFNATLRDYARFALLHLRGGEINGRRIVSTEWIAGTRFGADPTLFGGIYQEVLPAGAYHNQFWIEDTACGVYMARGVFGQLIYIDPMADFAAVVLSSWPEFVSTTRTRTALAAVRSIRGALSP